MVVPSDEPDDDPTDDEQGDSVADGNDASGRPPAGDISAYTTEERSVTASVQLIWAVRALIGIAILAVIASVVAGRFGVDRRFVVGGAVVLALISLVWVHLRYRVWSYRIREDALYLERGVITNVKTVAPHVRIQHVDTQRGPLERSLGLSTLVVYTAGSRGADVAIPGLRTDAAADLQRRVKELAIESEGGDAL